MSVQEPDDGAVKLDYAEARGLMGYPPILGELVTVRLLTSGESYAVGDMSVTPHVEFSGLVCGLGPLGYVIEHPFGTTAADALSGFSFLGQRMFFPWSAGTIRWSLPVVVPSNASESEG